MKLIITLIGLLLAGCVQWSQESRLPSLPQQMEKPRPNYSGGSIWQASSSGLVEDFKARARGDIVTVVITEQASASKQATTGTSRTTAVSAGIPNYLGLETTAI